MYSVVFHEDNEPSLTELRHWTNYLKKDILFIPHSKSNNISFSYNITQDFINFRLKVGDFEIKSEDVKFIWFNKGLLEFKIEKISSDLKNIDWYFKNEYEFAISNLYKIIEFISINTPPRYQLSKIESLMMARALGLQIPTTHVIQNKKELQEITEGNNNVFISKGLQEGISIKKRNKHYTTYTQLINHDLLSDLPEQFFPSLIQKKVGKLCDVRVFIFLDSVYSAAIFSNQEAKYSGINDFKYSNEESGIRIVPIKIREDIENKCLNLIKSLKLKTASLDFILDLNGNFQFIEINPVGNYLFINTACNYYLNKTIISKL